MKVDLGGACDPALELCEAADAANDQPTCDLLTQRMQVHEKNAWMLRSLLEDGGKG